MEVAQLLSLPGSTDHPATVVLLLVLGRHGRANIGAFIDDKTA